MTHPIKAPNKEGTALVKASVYAEAKSLMPWAKVILNMGSGYWRGFATPEAFEFWQETN